MSSSPPPTKRKRTEADTDESDLSSLPEDTVKHSSEFWFEDGNVVLQAEDTQFRVHRSILSRHSPIMNDCFLCTQPKDAPMVEGCPLVQLPDSAEDIRNMCELMYGMYHIDLENVTSSYLKTMLLLGRKYDIVSFTTSAELFLKQIFPPTLEKWDAFKKDVEAISARNKGFLFDVFNLVFEYPIPSIMQPLLVSMCTIHSLAQIKSGISRRGQPRAILKHHAKQYCLYGRTIFMQLSLKTFMDAYCSDLKDESQYRIPTPSCTDKSICEIELRDIVTELIVKHTTDDAVEFPRPRTTHYGETDLCFPCFSHLQELIEEGRFALWEALPSALLKDKLHPD